MINIENLKEEIKEIEKWLIETRRDFHMNPELGKDEFRTMETIVKYLDEMKVSYFKGIFDTGVVAEVPGKDRDFTVALRADMDALPIIDEKSVEYASKNYGKCHACGHDVHMTVALGVLKYFKENKIEPPCNIRVIFQPAEETVGGAKPMIELGVLKGVNKVYGLHVDETIDSGQIGIKYGPMNASSDTLKINILGDSCHGAYPSRGVDAIVIASHVIVGLQSIISRNLDARESGVITLGTIKGGTQGNIICQKVELVGTLRTLDNGIRKKIKERIKEVVEYTCKAHGGQCEISIEEGYTALVNHKEEVDIIKNNGKLLFGSENIVEKEQANMGVEDFSYFIENTKGAFFTLGIKNKSKNIIYPAHNGKFDIDEDAIKNGVMMQILNIYSK